ncbi:hypothetical protein OROMI_023185 [Orobanche minor]
MMNESVFARSPAYYLDPGAQEFFPTTTLPSGLPQLYYPYPPLPPYDNTEYAWPQFSSPPAYVGSAADPPPPPPPLPTPLVFLPLSSEPPSRTLLLSMVPTSVSESTVRRELEVFGDVRAVQMERRREGLVTVHFYDVREAQAALTSIQEQHMQQQHRLGRHYDALLNNPIALAAVVPPQPQTARGLILGRVVWAQFTTPVTSGLPDGNNQGTLVIFNLEPVVSAAYLRDIFEAFGPVKELRETANNRNQRFVEFYDVRHASKAMSEMNGKQIYGQTIVIEYSRPGGHCKKFPANYSSRNSLRCWPPSLTTRNPENKPSARSTQRCSNYPSKGNPNARDKSHPNTRPSIHEPMASLSIGAYEELPSVNNGTRKKHNSNSSKKSNNVNIISCKSGSGNGSSKQQPSHGGKLWKGGGGGGHGSSKQQPSHGGKLWKEGGGGRRGKDGDPRFLINEDVIVEDSDCRDPRTTVMIKNIPNKYSQNLLLNMLDSHCSHCNEQITDGDEDHPLSSYDFVYLPIDFINKCNVGYGFVNMTTPQATLRLYKAFHHQNWEVFNSRKICEVTYARLQGLEALKEHFKNSKFPNEAEEYMPVVFSPPRDGCILSEPLPIKSRVDGSPSSATSSKENRSEPPIGVNDHLIDREYQSEPPIGGVNDHIIDSAASCGDGNVGGSCCGHYGNDD